MQNLAGNKGCDPITRGELEKAGIKVVQHSEILSGEVPTSLSGVLRYCGHDMFTFHRAWYYWVVSGEVPLEIAQEMYKDPVGRDDVRVAGHCGRPSPDQWAFPKSDVLRDLSAEKGIDFERVPFGKLAKMCNSGVIDAPRFVSTYHIDSQEGLDLFVVTMRKYGLGDPP